MARPWYDMHDCGDRYAAAVGLTPCPSRPASPATACLCAPLPPCFLLAHRVIPPPLPYLAVTPMPHGGRHAGAWSRASAACGRAGRRGGAALATRAAATSAPRRQRRETAGTLTTAATGARSGPSAACPGAACLLLGTSPCALPARRSGESGTSAGRARRAAAALVPSRTAAGRRALAPGTPTAARRRAPRAWCIGPRIGSSAGRADAAMPSAAARRAAARAGTRASATRAPRPLLTYYLLTYVPIIAEAVPCFLTPSRAAPGAPSDVSKHTS